MLAFGRTLIYVVEIEMNEEVLKEQYIKHPTSSSSAYIYPWRRPTCAQKYALQRTRLWSSLVARCTKQTGGHYVLLIHFLCLSLEL